MPRGKFINHKGKRRQFTPVEVLQREDDREDCKAEKSFDGKCKKLGGAVEGLIEISNPNRSIKKIERLASSSDLSGPETPNGERRQERTKDKFITQKSPSEINADLARLALVRKKREAAAEQRRLAFAKKDAPELQTSKSELLIDKSYKKFNPNSETSDQKYINENLGKHIKGRNGTKRNVNMHV